VSYLTASAAGAGAIALVELDAASVGPFLLSRPLVVGPLVGWLCGNVWAGAVLGGTFEALTLEEMPLGGCLDFSAPVAAGAAAWLSAGPAGLPSEAAFLAGLSAGWAHARLERLLRKIRGSRVGAVETRTAAGRAPSLGATLAEALAEQGAATFLVSFAALAALGPVLSRLWPALPEFLRAGARAAFLAAPWLGAGSLAAALMRRAS
jgi:mannose/fructose/N-acetylgalactosamine-specific phosphotransferase system component IIC